MPRYTIRDLFLMTTLVALGLTMMVLATQGIKHDRWVSIVHALAMPAGGILIGIGLGRPFNMEVFLSAAGCLIALFYLVFVSLQFGHLTPH